MTRLRAAAVLACLLALAACSAPPAPTPGAERPAQAVRLLAARLRANDAAGFATIALPPALHARVAAGWRDGRSRWPLEELPLDERLPALLHALAAPGAEAALLRDFDRQFARSGGELRTAAVSLGLFGVEYLRKEGHYTDAEREHYVQVVQALSRWAARAPLADRTRARRALASLSAAARNTGIGTDADLARLGMDPSLVRLGPFFGNGKQALRAYGLDLDAALDSFDADLVEQTGDTARVRLRYTLAGVPVDAFVLMRRVDGRWYLDGFLRDAEASLQARPLPATAATAAATVPAGTGSP